MALMVGTWLHTGVFRVDPLDGQFGGTLVLIRDSDWPVGACISVCVSHLHAGHPRSRRRRRRSPTGMTGAPPGSSWQRRVRWKRVDLRWSCAAKLDPQRVALVLGPEPSRRPPHRALLAPDSLRGTSRRRCRSSLLRTRSSALSKRMSSARRTVGVDAVVRRNNNGPAPQRTPGEN